MRKPTEDDYESYSDDQYESSQRDYSDWEIEYYNPADKVMSQGWYVNIMTIEELKQKHGTENRNRSDNKNG